MTGIVWNVKCGMPLEGDVMEILLERYTRDEHEKYLNRTKEDVLLGSKHREYGTLLREVDDEDFEDSYSDRVDELTLDLHDGKEVYGLRMGQAYNLTEAIERMLGGQKLMVGYVCDSDAGDTRPLYFKIEEGNGHKNLMFCSFNPLKEKGEVYWYPVMHILRDQDLSASVWFDLE